MSQSSKISSLTILRTMNSTIFRKIASLITTLPIDIVKDFASPPEKDVDPEGYLLSCIYSHILVNALKKRYNPGRRCNIKTCGIHVLMYQVDCTETVIKSVQQKLQLAGYQIICTRYDLKEFDIIWSTDGIEEFASIVNEVSVNKMHEGI